MWRHVSVLAVGHLQGAGLSFFLACVASVATYRVGILLLLLPVALRRHEGHGLLTLEVSRSHTTTHHIR